MRRVALRALGIPHAALTTALAALMLASIPIGAYVLFSPGSHDGPELALGGLRVLLPVSESVGYTLLALWCAYAAMVGIALAGPRLWFGRTVTRIAKGNNGTAWLCENALVAAVSWFAILLLASLFINAVQGSQGITIDPPDYGGDMLRLHDATRAPIIEEVGFRVLLIGVPLAAIHAARVRPVCALRSLLHPHASLGPHGMRGVAALIFASAAVFGVLHIVGDDSWSTGKLTQAATAGVILGWVYYRHGLLVAILVHWATNYFLLTFLHFVAGPSADLVAASSHPAAMALEVLIVVSGIIAGLNISFGRANA